MIEDIKITTVMKENSELEITEIIINKWNRDIINLTDYETFEIPVAIGDRWKIDSFIGMCKDANVKFSIEG